MTERKNVLVALRGPQIIDQAWLDTYAKPTKSTPSMYFIAAHLNSPIVVEVTASGTFAAFGGNRIFNNEVTRDQIVGLCDLFEIDLLALREERNKACF